MTMPLSGLISLFDCNTEFGRPRTGSVSLQASDVRGLAGVVGAGNSLWDLYGKSTVTNYAWYVAGTYVIPGEAGKTSATVDMLGGGGGGGGGGHGGWVDSQGSGGGGGGGGAGGETKYGIVRFASGASLTVVVGAAGYSGIAGASWRYTDGAWRYGDHGGDGGLGGASYVHDGTNLFAIIQGGGGGQGGRGGDRHSGVNSAGGFGGYGLPVGNRGQNGQDSVFSSGGWESGYTRGGNGGIGSGYTGGGVLNRNGGVGGHGGDGAGWYGGTAGGDPNIVGRGTGGTYGTDGSAVVQFGYAAAGAPELPALTFSVEVGDSDVDVRDASVSFYATNGVPPYSAVWVIDYTNNVTFTNLTFNSMHAQCPHGGGGEGSFHCTVTDAIGRVAVGSGSIVMFDTVNCVAVDSFLPDGSIAGDIAVGSVMELADNVSLLPATGVVSYSEKFTQASFRFTTVSGASLRCSSTAPIPTLDNGYMTPAHLLGQQVAVKHVGGDTLWEEVVSVEDIGLIEVQHITVGNKCFWAGETTDAFILHHNDKVPP